jgi:hypothetical protein
MYSNAPPPQRDAHVRPTCNVGHLVRFCLEVAVRRFTQTGEASELLRPIGMRVETCWIYFSSVFREVECLRKIANQRPAFPFHRRCPSCGRGTSSRRNRSATLDHSGRASLFCFCGCVENRLAGPSRDMLQTRRGFADFWQGFLKTWWLIQLHFHFMFLASRCGRQRCPRKEHNGASCSIDVTPLNNEPFRRQNFVAALLAFCEHRNIETRMYPTEAMC